MTGRTTLAATCLLAGMLAGCLQAEDHLGDPWDALPACPIDLPDGSSLACGAADLTEPKGPPSPVNGWKCVSTHDGDFYRLDLHVRSDGAVALWYDGEAWKEDGVVLATVAILDGEQAQFATARLPHGPASGFINMPPFETDRPVHIDYLVQQFRLFRDTPEGPVVESADLSIGSPGGERYYVWTKGGHALDIMRPYDSEELHWSWVPDEVSEGGLLATTLGEGVSLRDQDFTRFRFTTTACGL